MALARVSDLNVIAVEPDTAVFAGTRARLRAAGLYGTRVMIFNRPLSATGLLNMMANLVVSARAALKGKVLAEAKRIQRPCGGAICTVDGEEVAVDRRGEIPGAGRWTHQYANPANTLCSGDSALSGKLTMLWYRDYSLPSASRWWRAPAPLAAGGILYRACPNGVIAVDAYNGTEIWRFGSKGLLSGRAGYCVFRAGGVYCLGDGVLYLRSKDRCLCLDAKTGKLLRKIPLPDAKAHDFWGYLAYSDGVVYGTAADTSHNMTLPWPVKKGVLEGKTLFAVDARTRRVLWQYEPKDHIANRAVAIDDRNVYVVDRVGLWTDPTKRRQAGAARRISPGTLVALDKKTGAVRWSADAGALGSAVMVSGSARRVCIWHEDRLAGYDAKTGKRLYTVQSPYRCNIYVIKAPAMIGKTLYWNRHAFDVRGGKKLNHELLRSYGCGSMSASQSMLFFRSGTVGYVDITAPRADGRNITIREIQNFGGIRPGCYISIVPAGGVVLIPDSSASCVCSYFNQCWIALQPAPKR